MSKFKVNNIYSSANFIDDVDITKKIKLDVSGITSGTIRTLTVPNANTTLVGDSTVDTLTNKTISSSTNTVGANQLMTTGAPVVIGSASPPTTGQILKATSATTATWQTISASVANTEVSNTATHNTTSGTYIVINSMTNTPGSGTYFVSFSASGRTSAMNAIVHFAIFKDGTIIAHSEREVFDGSGLAAPFSISLHTQSVVSVNGSEAIDVRMKTTAGTFSVYERSFTLLQLT